MKNKSTTLICLALLGISTNAGAAGVSTQGTSPVDAGSLLNQLNKFNETKFVPSPSVQEEQIIFSSYEIIGLPDNVLQIANAYVKNYVDKSIPLKNISDKLSDFLQKQNRDFNYVFLTRFIDGKLYLVGQKVIFGQLIVDQNKSRYNDELLREVLSFKLKSGETLDHQQLERNAEVLNELPGVINQFQMTPSEKPGASDLYLRSDGLSLLNGSVSFDNSNSDSLGSFTGRSDIALNNFFRHADIIRLNAQKTSNSSSIGIDASTLVSISGLRGGFNASVFEYSYLQNASGKDAVGDMQSTGSTYKGTAKSLGLDFTYPSARSDESRHNLTLDFNHNISSSNVDILQTTISSSLGNTSTQGANFNLSEIVVNKVALGANGMFSAGNSGVVSYQANLLFGRAEEEVSSAALQDNYGVMDLGSFYKFSAYMQYINNLIISNKPLKISLSGDLQLSSHNLVGPENVYFGGVNKMQAWQPQAVGGPQGIYGKIELSQAIGSIPNLTGSVFLEVGQIQVNKYPYLITSGTTTMAADNEFKLMADVGTHFDYQLFRETMLTIAVAKKITSNPVINGAKLDDSSHVRAWVYLKRSFN